jgi:hypothetical protein
MDNTKPNEIPQTSAEKINLSDHNQSEEPEKKPGKSVSDQIHHDIKVIYLTLSNLPKTFSIRINPTQIEEQDRIRQLNEFIENNEHSLKK